MFAEGNMDVDSGHEEVKVNGYWLIENGGRSEKRSKIQSREN
jgi:hypothetical protein